MRQPVKQMSLSRLSDAGDEGTTIKKMSHSLRGLRGAKKWMRGLLVTRSGRLATSCENYAYRDEGHEGNDVTRWAGGAAGDSI